MVDDLQYAVAPTGGTLVSDSREACKPLPAVAICRLAVNVVSIAAGTGVRADCTTALGKCGTCRGVSLVAVTGAVTVISIGNGFVLLDSWYIWKRSQPFRIVNLQWLLVMNLFSQSFYGLNINGTITAQQLSIISSFQR